MFFKRKGNNGRAGATALQERPAPAADFHGSDDELWREIGRMTEANHAAPDRETEREILRLRHIAGMRRVDAAPSHPRHPEPDTAALGANGSLPEFTRDQLSPGLLRAGILRDGCLLVRGLVDRDQALAFAAQIDRAFAERERHDAGEASEPGYYEEFYPHARFGGEVGGRPWIKEGGGVLAADSPMLAAEMMDLFTQANLPAIVGGYLGEPPLISVHKTTLRKAEPQVPGAWHQDGRFMGQVRSLNLWLSLSRCGDEAPGLDILPKRLDDFLTAQTDEAMLDFQVSQRMVEDAAGDTPIVRPIFEPGDALFFDDMFLHQTGSDPSMPKPRYAIENWFFGGSAFPADYAPIAV